MTQSSNEPARLDDKLEQAQAWMREQQRERKERRERCNRLALLLARGLTALIVARQWGGIAVEYEGNGDSGDVSEVFAYAPTSLIHRTGGHVDDGDSLHEYRNTGDSLDISLDALWEAETSDAPIDDDGSEGEALPSPDVQEAVQHFASMAEEQTVGSIVHSAACALLSSHHSGWENNEGGYGWVCFTAEGKVVLDHYERESVARPTTTHIT